MSVSFSEQVTPERASNIIDACGILWNIGIILGENDGYDPDTEDKDEMEVDTDETVGGTLLRERVVNYLWNTRNN